MENTFPTGNQKSRALEYHFHYTLRWCFETEVFRLLPTLGFYISMFHIGHIIIIYTESVESFFPHACLQVKVCTA